MSARRGVMEKKGVMEASTVVNYSKEEVEELLRKSTGVEVGRVILVNYRPAVLRKRKVKVGKIEDEQKEGENQTNI